MTFLREFRRKGLLLFGTVTLTVAPLLGLLAQRPATRSGAADSRASSPAERVGQGRRSSLPRPVAGACPGEAHGANHGASDSAAVVDEHLFQFCAMLPRSEATHTAVASGDWSSPRTWDGRLPQADARVLIPPGVTVTVDRELSAPLFSVRVEGLLRFSADANTALIVDTVKVEDGGRLEMGTAAKPIPAGVTARIIVKAHGGKPIDHNWDPLELSRGVVAHGIVEIHGATKTPFVAVSEMPRTGTPSIVVDQPPIGWTPGDILVLTATEYDQDETFKLVRVDGTRVTLDRPVRNPRILPEFERAPGWPAPKLHLGNFTRNVQISTDPAHAGDPKLQGHLMLMHRSGQKISWVGLYDLGRTTIKPVTDPAVRDGRRDAGVNPAAGLTAENVRGRYSLHFHGAGPTPDISRVEGCAIEVRRGAGFKIGVANHSSNVSVRGCVSHNIDGSHFFTEEGDEIGEFNGNLAVHSVGSGTDRDEQPRDVVLKQDPRLHQRRRLDAGHRGTGFWLNGGGVDVIDNVSAGQAHSGFHLWTRPLNFRITDTYAVRFPAANLRDRSWLSGTDSLTIDAVPIRFVGNTAYVLGRTKNRGEGGFLFELHGIGIKSRFPNAPYSQMHNLLSWNAGGIKTQYTGNLHLKNVRILGKFLRADDVGARLGAQGGNNDLIENLRVEGFPRGVTLPTQSTIKGGYFATGVGIPLGAGHDVTIDLTDMQFVPVDAVGGAAAGTGRARDRAPAVNSSGMQYDLHLQPIFAGADFNATAAFSARRPTYVRGHPQYPEGAQLYSLEQMPDYILPDFGIPGLLDGKTTTREAWEKYRLAPGGAMAPAGTAPLPGLRSNGVFGSPSEVNLAASGIARRGPQRVSAGGTRSVPRSAPQGTREQRSPEQSVDRPTREEMAAIRDRRSANRAARRGTQESPGQPALQEPTTAPDDRSPDPYERQRPNREPAAQASPDQSPGREARRNRGERPTAESRIERGNTQSPNSDRQTDSTSGPAWELAPQPSGGAMLVPTGRRPRIPAVNAGSDQTVSLSEGGMLHGSAGDAASLQWRRAYGPGSVVFDEPGRVQTRARFSAPGTYVLHLTVEDHAGQKNTASMTVFVK